MHYRRKRHIAPMTINLTLIKPQNKSLQLFIVIALIKDYLITNQHFLRFFYGTTILLKTYWSNSLSNMLAKISAKYNYIVCHTSAVDA